ncbi:MAG: hypothetical protein U5N26_02390 [Candidatus Marinimicrobia bacterium]|nr:hypothetical protein [Candidatus Neomarinimicrobiota bacterium]
MLIAAALFVEAEPLISALNARMIEKYSKNTGLYRCHAHDILITGIGAKMAERTLLRYMGTYTPRIPAEYRDGGHARSGPLPQRGVRDHRLL